MTTESPETLAESEAGAMLPPATGSAWRLSGREVPNSEQPVLGIATSIHHGNHRPVIRLCRYCASGHDPGWTNEYGDGVSVTHWMPLPDMPSGSQ